MRERGELLKKQLLSAASEPNVEENPIVDSSPGPIVEPAARSPADAPPQLSRGFMMASLGFRGLRTDDGGLALFQLGSCEHCRAPICMGLDKVAPPIDENQWAALPRVEMPKRNGRRFHTAAPTLCDECLAAWLKPNNSLERTREG
jgi:hypothetical protein